MQSRWKFKQIVSFILTACMALTFMPAYTLAEDVVAPDAGVTVEVIPVDPSVNDIPEPADEPALEPPPGDPDVDDSEPGENPATLSEDETPEAWDSAEEEVTPDTETEPELPEEAAPEGDSPEGEEPAAEDPQDPEGQEELLPVVQPEDTPTEPVSEAPAETAEDPVDTRHPLQEALDTYGHIYVLTVRKTGVYSSPVLKADTLLFTTDNDLFPLLATSYTEHDTIVVWFLDAEGNVVKGFVSIKNLDEMYLLDEDAPNNYDLPFGEGMTSIGMMKLFIVSGTYPASGETEQDPEPAVETETYPEMQEEPQLQDTPETDETPVGDVLFVDPDKDLAGEDGEPVVPDEIPEVPEDQPQDVETAPESTQESADTAEQETAVPVHTEGEYITVTVKTRAFEDVDPGASETQYGPAYLGNFVKDATVQVKSVLIDENGNVWYQVRYLYGDDFANGRMKWTRYGTAWVLESETGEAAGDACTVTDLAYTLEYLRTTRGSGRRGLLGATPMQGFTLKSINAPIASFHAFMTGLYGSSGIDDYPQIAASPSHGVIYATPHFLEGFTVYCLEHKLAGPGEVSGDSLTAKGPYVLVDMDAFVSDPAYGGTSGVRFKASTMHALGWVLRHTYPFMVLDRSDTNNETWSRVAGQFAMREVIKQLEGAQYVRDYWDMDNFYAHRAPEVYLTYARWLAENGIARSRITGNITASNQSLIKSGSSFVGTVTLTTDADLIRIPRTVGTLTGNSGGSDSSYYYLKSGDTISITSPVSEFTVTMESISSDDEEANFLVGVPSVSIQKVLVPLYGSPYPLKSGSLDFELSEGEILVIKKSDDGKLLQGAVFVLKDRYGTVIATATTSDDGTVLFTNIQPGTYTIQETTPPQGYHLALDTSKEISVTAGSRTEVTVINASILARVRVVKTDALTQRPLKGVVFTVTRVSDPGSGTVAAVITTDAQGVAETDPLPAGEYRIDETVVPEGYVDAGYTATVVIE